MLGDRNTKYYHASTVSRKSPKNGLGIKNIVDETITGRKDIKDLFLWYFMDIFRKDVFCDPNIAPRGCFP